MDSLAVKGTFCSLDCQGFILLWKSQTHHVKPGWEAERNRKGTRIMYWNLPQGPTSSPYIALATVSIMAQKSSTCFCETKHWRQEPVGRFPVGSFHIQIVISMDSTHVLGRTPRDAFLTRLEGMHRRNDALLKTMLLLISTKSLVWH